MGSVNWTMPVYIVLIVAFVYFAMIRPGSKRVKAQQAVINSLQPGARVMLTSGIFGTIQAVGERQIVVELAPGVEVTALKQAISRVTGSDDEEFEYSDSLEEADLTNDADQSVSECALTSGDSSASTLVDETDEPDRPDDWTRPADDSSSKK